MDETHVVTCFLRHGGDVLLLRRSDAVGSYSGQWGAVAGHAEGDPDGAAREEIREETGLDPDRCVTPVRGGDPFPVDDADLDTRWVVHPFLFDVVGRPRDAERPAIEPNEETAEYEWVPPTEILRRETVPDLWTSYDRVRPGVESVEDDSDHGSAFLSLRALEVLRDEAALAASGHTEANWADLEAIARDLVAARPSMPVVRNRVDRAMVTACEEATAATLAESAHEGIDSALGANGDAAATAGVRIRSQRVATLSRSGTVETALHAADPEAVLVAESRPSGEGVDVAEGLADGLDAPITLTTDAGLAHQFAAWDADALLVGADALLAGGSVVNKVGTRGAALASSYEGIEVVVVAASDKITPEKAVDLVERDPAELYAGDSEIAVENPTFDVTPADVVDAVVTERGVLDAGEVGDVAEEHRGLGEWRRG